jgi:glycosyltransferase involved in cell wall biosynthesis
MNPLVSILMPAYNAERWIGEAIESARAQTWSPTEIIIVDDESSDRTFEVAKRFESKNIRVLRQDNQGASVARNTAYSNCQGHYIQWLDADDLLDPRKVESQMNAVSRDASDRTLLSGAWGYFHYRKRKTRFNPSPLWNDLAPVEWLLLKMGQNHHMQTDNWLVSRTLSEAAGPWDRRLWRDNDGEYFCRVILASDGIRFVKEARSYYRAAGVKSISYIAGSDKKLESLFLSMKLHISYLLSLEDSERTRAVCIKFIENWLFEFYPFRLDLAEQLKSIAAGLGREVGDPHLSWKYDWIVRHFGWRAGRKIQLLLPKMRRLSVIALDRALAKIEERLDRSAPKH